MRPGARRPDVLLALFLAAGPLGAAAGCASRRATVATPPAAAASSHAGALASAFAAAPDGLAIWSLQFVWADTGELIYERDPDTRLLPASNMKLVTLAAAGVRLGWDHRFETTLSAPVAPVAGVLHGPLEVRGSGDPTLGWPTEQAMAQMRALAAQVRAAGVVRVEGPLVGDPDARGRERFGDAWSWDDLPFAYAAPYAALTFHENTVAVRVTPAARNGEAAQVALEPAGSGMQLDHDVRTLETPASPGVTVERALGSDTLVVRGEVRAGDSAVTRLVAVADPARFFLGALRIALALEGVEVRGETRVAALPALAALPSPSGRLGEPSLPSITSPPSLPSITSPPSLPLITPQPSLPSPPLLVTHSSAPLADIAVRFMKESQNLYGEALQHALTPGRDATLTDRRTAIEQALSALAVPTDDLRVADGSGLSRRNFVSARTLVRLLQALDTPPHRDVVRRALPVAGVDGTLERRLDGTACEGRVRAKTGTLSHARALSGYLTTPSGREVIFSVLANNHLQPTSAVDAVVDAALLTLCAWGQVS